MRVARNPEVASPLVPEINGSRLTGTVHFDFSLEPRAELLKGWHFLWGDNTDFRLLDDEQRLKDVGLER